jgi:hypothetical protein
MSASLTVSVQCEKRGGTPPVGDAAIRSCGFDVKTTEAVGEHTSDEAAAAGVATQPVVPPAAYAIPGVTAALQALSRSQNSAGAAAAAGDGGLKPLVPIDVLVPREERVPAAQVLSILRVETKLGMAPLEAPLMVMAPPERGAAPAAADADAAAADAEPAADAPMEEQAERENVVAREEPRSRAEKVVPKHAAAAPPPRAQEPATEAAPTGDGGRAHAVTGYTPPGASLHAQAPRPAKMPPALAALSGRGAGGGAAAVDRAPRAARPTLTEPSSAGGTSSSAGAATRAGSLLDAVSSSYFVYIVLILGGLELLLLAYLFCRFRGLSGLCCGGSATSAARRHGLMAVKTGPRV